MSKLIRMDKTDETNTNLYLYGEIRKDNLIEEWLGIEGSNADAVTLREALEMVDTPKLTVRINSMGGSVSEGLAIYNQLNDFKGEVTTIIDGFACSIAAVIFMAGDKRIANEGSLLMIHNAWSNITGDHNDLAKASEDLKKITQPSINIFTSKTNLEEEKVVELMDRESWLTSQESFDYGFATSMTRNEAQQSLEDKYFYNMVMKAKKLEDELTEIKSSFKQEPISKWNGFFNTER